MFTDQSRRKFVSPVISDTGEIKYKHVKKELKSASISTNENIKAI